jgi:hypothetical protein
METSNAPSKVYAYARTAEGNTATVCAYTHGVNTDATLKFKYARLLCRLPHAH